MELTLIEYLKSNPVLLLAFMAGGFWARYEFAKRNGNAPLTKTDLKDEMRPLSVSMQALVGEMKEQNGYIRGLLSKRDVQ